MFSKACPASGIGMMKRGERQQSVVVYLHLVVRCLAVVQRVVELRQRVLVCVVVQVERMWDFVVATESLRPVSTRIQLLDYAAAVLGRAF
jgi:hypothetical protein